jgi:hypothetical protein
MNIDTSPYLIRTLTNKINLLLLNFLYSKPYLNVRIDDYNYNIIIIMSSQEEYNETLNEVKKYYRENEYLVRTPPVPIFPEFVTSIL